MIFTSFKNFMVVNAIPFIILYIVFIEISAILLLDSGVFSNTFYIQLIGSGIVIFSGLFQAFITLYSNLLELDQTVYSSLELYILTTLYTNFSLFPIRLMSSSSNKTKNKVKNKVKISDVHWSNYYFNLPNLSLITNSLIKKAINSFWESHVSFIKDDQHILVLFRVQDNSGFWYTLGNLQKINKDSLNFYIDFVNDILSIKTDEYKEIKINQIAISFGIRQGKIETQKTFVQLEKSEYQNYKHYKLPITMDPLKYGDILHIDKDLHLIQLKSLTIAKIITINDGVTLKNKVEIIKKGKTILSYIDLKINDNKFERSIGFNKYIYILDPELNRYSLSLLMVNKPAQKIKTLKPNKPLSKNKIVTMDLETFTLKNGSMIPYLLSWFDGSVSKSYFLTDFNNSDDMLLKGVKDLLKVKYKGFKIYLHNFAKFDAIFLLDTLTKLGSCTPIINKGRIISISLTFNLNDEPNKNLNFYNIEFRDSIQILLGSLRKLAKAFDVPIQKGIFPHSFVNENNLNYIGPVPKFEFFDGITLDEYNDYCSNFSNNWSLRDESIKYCNQDCISLYQILVKFTKLIFNNFKVNISKYPTLPSLSFGIFRTLYLKSQYFISMLSGKIFKNLQLSYTGGATDMYIPTNSKNEKVYCYDVNSLYPSVMLNNPMPLGKATYFEGDIRKYNKNSFGFFYCKIRVPNNLKHPILQTHVKTKSGIRTVAALGTYKDMLFTPEMDNAIKFGYKFDILWGYTFEKGYIFSDFINTLYDMRLQYDKSNPLNYIAKIIMNSLYGRFGMDDMFTSSVIVDKNDYTNFEKHNIGFINDVKSLSDNYLVTINIDNRKTMLDNCSETHNVNIAIASAITAYARIVMSQFKNNHKLKLFYTDTDSIYTNLSPDEMNKLFPGIINEKELGKLKLENICTKAIFISPKCYYLKTIEGNEIFKVKGLNKEGISTLTKEDFESLLIHNTQILKNQSKWFKSLSNSSISIKENIYTIQQTANKRELIYNSDNILVGTKPYIISEEKSI